MKSQIGTALFIVATALCPLVHTAFAESTDYNCQSGPGAGRTLRSEAIDELVPDILITCTGSFSIPTFEPVATAEFAVTLNVPIANPIGTVQGTVFTDALLLDNDPPPDKQVVAAPSKYSLSFQGIVTRTPGGYASSIGAVPNVYRGRIADSHTVIFSGIPILNVDGGTHTYRITNLRADMHGVPSSSRNPASLTYKLAIKSNGGYQIVLVIDSGNSGTIQSRFLFNTTPGTAPANQSLNSSLMSSNPVKPAAPSATLNFNGLFAGAYKAPANGSQNIAGQIYNTEAGFTSADVAPDFANYGTRLKAVFNNVPAGVRLFTDSSVISGNGTAQLKSPGTPAGSTGLTELPVSNGSALAIWEVTSTSLTEVERFNPGLYVAFAQGGAKAPGNITVTQSLDSPPGAVQFVQPSPSAFQPDVFMLTTGSTAQSTVGATLDTSPCILGPTFYTNNICAPGSNGPALNLFSDNAPVVPTVSIQTSGGVTFLNNPNTYGQTPDVVNLFAPKGSTPGVFQQTINVTGTKASNTVSLPFTVTVLPANSPVFEWSGVTDAFSYQTGSIAPGEIFAIFGTNFGPSNLALGTLDGSGKLATSVANTQVLFDSVPAPLIYVANGQLSGVAPFELSGKSSTSIQVISNGLTSPTVTLPVVPASITLASLDGSGGKGAVVINKDGTVNSPDNPASAGDVVVIYAAYGGPFAGNINGTDGRTTLGAPYPAPAGALSVSFGGVPATDIRYFGNAPTLLESVMQINVTIPGGVQADTHVPLIMSAGGATSQPWTTIAIK